jgi:uncharacterized protein (DUF58 family)
VLATLAALTALAGLLLLLAGLLLAAALLLLAGFLLAAALLAAAALLTALVRVLIGHFTDLQRCHSPSIISPRIALKFLTEHDANARKDRKIKAKSGETAPTPRPHTGL